MTAIIKWTLYQRRISIIWWSVAVFLLIFVSMIFYPSFKDQAAELEKSFANIPESTLQFVGGSTDFFSPVGFLNSQIYFITLPLVLGVLAINLGSSMLAREEQDGTLEALLARPISRTKLLLGKAAAGCLVIVFVTLIALAAIVGTAKMVDLPVGTGSMVLATLACLMLVLSFWAVSFLLSATGRARGASIGIAAFVALGGYVISSLAGTVSWLQQIAKVFPFHYYKPEPILRGSTPWGDILLLAVVAVIAVVLASLAFRRRDLRG